MPRFDADRVVYDVAARWVDAALRRDDSLFTPGVAIWTLARLDELDRLYVQRPDLGEGSFEDKLHAQLDGASPAAVQLMAEILFVYYLPARYNISGPTKRQKLEQVLSWMPSPVSIPADLLEVTDHGVGSGGPGFHLYKWASVAFLVAFARRWKQSPIDIRQRALEDPWAFLDFVLQIPTDGGGIYGRESLLHLVFPDTFERIFSGQDKWRLAEALKAVVDDPSASIDRRIAQIRKNLESRFGSDFDFYDTDGVRALWKRFDDPLDEFVYWGARFHELKDFVPEERTYKLEIVKRLTAARAALLDDGEWLPLLKRSFSSPNNLTNWQSHEAFLRWCQDDIPRAAKLIRRIWVGEDEVIERLGDFLAHLPNEVVSGMGSRTTLGSFLLLAIDPYLYPPYRTAAMHAAYRITKYDPGDEKNEVAMYRAALAFLDRLRERAAERGLVLADRLDAQSVVWCITNWAPPEQWPAEDQIAFDRFRQGVTEEEVEELPPAGPTDPPAIPAADPLIALADQLLLAQSDLVEVRELLTSKRQIIIYGPPGTGKTYVARKLALALAGDPARVRLVQFHPSYAYEDFVEGFRPATVGGTYAFELTPGPMKLLAAAALEDPGHDYYLVIDELNRGNVAKVFGELYFLLEYRDEEVLLQYSARPFRLPKNLFVIGTMNTADRSIALLDAALRRRFAFVPFFPDRPPIDGLLRRWLQRHRPEMAWVADVVDEANRRLADRNAAIGPSFFMDAELNEVRLERVWCYEITPLLEDYFFDAPERLREFELARLQGFVEAEIPSKVSDTGLVSTLPSDGRELSETDDASPDAP
jgi:5-methylcytosine-specific restriction enzyme B